MQSRADRHDTELRTASWFPVVAFAGSAASRPGPHAGFTDAAAFADGIKTISTSTRPPPTQSRTRCAPPCWYRSPASPTIAPSSVPCSCDTTPPPPALPAPHYQPTSADLIGRGIGHPTALPGCSHRRARPVIPSLARMPQLALSRSVSSTNPQCARKAQLTAAPTRERVRKTIDQRTVRASREAVA